VLQAVENLLQSELHARQHAAMRPRHLVGCQRAARKGNDRGAGGNEEWKVGDDESEADDSACHRSNRRESSTRSNAARPAGVNVGIEADDDARSIDR